MSEAAPGWRPTRELRELCPNLSPTTFWRRMRWAEKMGLLSRQCHVGGDGGSRSSFRPKCGVDRIAAEIQRGPERRRIYRSTPLAGARKSRILLDTKRCFRPCGLMDSRLSGRTEDRSIANHYCVRQADGHSPAECDFIATCGRSLGGVPNPGVRATAQPEALEVIP